MIPKSGYRFSEKIMLQDLGASGRPKRGGRRRERADQNPSSPKRASARGVRARRLSPRGTTRGNSVHHLGRVVDTSGAFDAAIPSRAAVPLGHDIPAMGADGGAVCRCAVLLSPRHFVHRTTMRTGVLFAAQAHTFRPL